MNVRVHAGAPQGALIRSNSVAAESPHGHHRSAVARIVTRSLLAGLFLTASHAHAADTPRVNLREAHTLAADYRGPSTAAAMLKAGSARSLAIASADFDRNGTPDIVTGYATASGGILALQRGNPDAFAPTDDSVFVRMQQGYDPISLLPDVEVVAVPETPDFAAVGTFRDGEQGVLFARRGGGLYLMPVDGAGVPGVARRIPLPGAVTALAAGEFRAADGYTDFAVGVTGPKGHALLVFDDAAADFAKAALELPSAAPIVSAELAMLDDDAFRDLAAATAHELLVVHGWARNAPADVAARVERVAVGPDVVGLAVGEFTWDRAGRSEIATLSADGSVAIVRGADIDTRAFSKAEAAARTRGAMLARGSVVRDIESTPSWQAKRDGGWVVDGTMKVRAPKRLGHAIGAPLLRANLSFTEFDDLMVLGEGGVEVVHEVSKRSKSGAGISEATLLRTSLHGAGDPVAVLALPRKLNGVRDFVVLDGKEPSAVVVAQLPKATIVVDRTDDPSGAGLTAASVCSGSANDCSLRGAIQFANAAANTVISLPANTYVLSINGTSAGGCDGNTVGDLGANNSMTITGAGAGSTIIRQTGTGPASDGDRVMCMNEPFTIGLVYTYSGVTFVGGRDGTAAGTGTALGGGAIIGGELNNSLTLSNTVFANNQVTVLGSANIGGGGVQITGGSLVINNSLFGGTSGPGVYTDRSTTTSGNLQGGSGGGVMFTPSAPAHMGGSGTLTVTGTNFTFNRTGSICCGGAGLDLLIFAFASPGGIGSGSASIGTTTISNNNSAGGNGGGIIVESLPTTLNADTVITNNAAANRGGAVYVGGGNLMLNGTGPNPITMTGNTATNAGTSISCAAPVTVAGTLTTLGGSIEVGQGCAWTNNTGSAIAPTDVSVAGGQFFMNNSTMNVAGNLAILAGGTEGGRFNGQTGTVNLAGTFSFNNGGTPAGAFNAGTGTFNFNGSGFQTISNNVVITFNHLTDSNSTQLLQLNGSIAVNGNLTLNGPGTIVRPAPAVVISGTGTLTGSGRVHASRNFATADFLTQWTIANKTLTQLTVEYSGGGAQTVNSAPAYSNLVISGGGGLKTLQGNTTLTGNLHITSNGTLAGSTFNLGLRGNWTNENSFVPGTGTVTFNGTSGTQLITGNTTFYNLTLDNAGATTSFGTTSTTIQNDLVATNGTMEGGTSTISFTGVTDNAGAIGGAAAKNFHNLTISSPAVISNTAGGNLTIEGDFAATGTFTQGAGLTTTFATDNNANGNHGMSGGGATTFGNVTINASNSVDAGTHNFSVVGASCAVAGTLAGGNTVSFTGGVAQAISGDGSKTFNNLTINNANGVSVLDGTPAVDTTVAGALTLTTDLTVASGAVLQQAGTSAGVADVLGTVRRTDLGVTTRAFGNANNQITINSGTAPTQLDFTLAKANPAAFPSGARVVPRALTLTPTGGGPLSATLRLRYIDPGELTGPGITESRLGLWKLIGATWTPQGGVVDAASNHVTLAGVTSFSDWGIAEVADLTLAKANDVSNAAVVGQPWTWTLTATNVGTPATFASGQAILSDTLPNADVVYGAVSVQNVQNVTGTVSCAITSNDLTCTAAGGPVTFASNVGTSRFDVVFTATPQAAGAFQNPRAGGSAQIDPANLVAESSESNAAANTVTVAKASTTTTITADNPDPSLSGQAVTVTWNVAVNAPGALGAALTGNVTVSDGTVNCTAAVSAGQCDITFVTAGPKTLAATYAGDGNYNGSASTPVQHTVNIAAPTIAKAFAPDSIAIGGTSTVTLSLGNTNGVALTAAQFGDTLANMSAVGGAVTGTCVGTTPNTLGAGATALSFSGIGIPAGGSCTVIFSVTSSTVGTLPNTTTGVITAQTPAAGAPSNTANLTVSPSADLSITKTDGAAATTQGSPIAYTIVAANAGPTGVTGAMVNDTFPGSLTSCGWSCTGATGGTCTATGFGNIADTVDLPVNASVTYTANCTVAAAAVGTVQNTATVGAPAGVLDPAPGNNTATDVDTLPPLPDLTLIKTHLGNFTQGETGRIYTITVTNAGDGPTNGSTITVTDSVPAGLTPTAASGTGWTCGIAGQTMTCTRTDVLNAGAAAPPISLSVSVAANAAPLITNIASVAGGGNIASANDSASDPTTIGGDQLFSNGFE